MIIEFEVPSIVSILNEAGQPLYMHEAAEIAAKALAKRLLTDDSPELQSIKDGLSDEFWKLVGRNKAGITSDRRMELFPESPSEAPLG